MKLPEFFEALDRHAEHVPIETLVDLMGRLEITRPDVEHVVAFAPDGYERNLLHVGSGYAALVLCWRPGQSSPIHDHRGSACGVRVLDGVASERRYEIDARGIPQPGRKSLYPTGHVCGSWDADTHVMFNEQPPGRDLVTLHVYTPPLREIRTFAPGRPEVEIWSDTLTLEAIGDRETRLRGSGTSTPPAAPRAPSRAAAAARPARARDA